MTEKTPAPVVGVPLGTAARLLLQFEPTEAPKRQHRAPQLPPGVVPRGKAMALDSASTFGWLNQEGGAFCGMGFPGYQYLSELFQRSEYRAPVETIANEMTRKWIRFQGGDEKKRDELEQAFKDFAVREVCRLAVMHDGAFGRGQVYIVIKGQESPKARAKPLNVDEGNIPAGSLVGFKNIEPVWTTPLSYNSQDPTLPDFYRPVVWYVMGVETHADRLLTFIGRPLPDILKPSYNFSGLSLQQLVEPYVQRWLKTVDSINRLLSRFSCTHLSTNLLATLQQTENGPGSLNERIRIFTQFADNRGLVLLDKDSEELGQINTPLGGLSELQAQAQEHMAAPTHIPLVYLTGITPSGLNASSEGEIKVFQDYIAGEQKNLLDGNLRIMTHVIMLHLWGKVDDEITFEWVPLDTPTDKELSEMRKADGDRDTAYVGAGIVGAEEVRERLRGDPNSGYGFIEPGDVPPAPIEAEAAVGEEGKQADHERGQENAEADHARAVEMLDREAKNKPAQDEQQRDNLGRFGAGTANTPETREDVFNTLQAHQESLYEAEKQAGQALAQFEQHRGKGSGNIGGLMPDAVKATPEWKAAYAAHAKAFARLREFNGKFVPAFKKELSALRDKRRNDELTRRRAAGETD